MAQPLLEAVWKGDIARIQRELDGGANANQADVRIDFVS
jgi:hypothetical protein